jgi:hypothetical protein
MTKVLVVVTAPVAPDEISSPIENRFGGDAEFTVIPLFARSDRGGEVVVADPAGMIDQARRRYGADQVVVVTRVSDEESWVGSGAVESARDQLEVPVTHLLVA